MNPADTLTRIDVYRPFGKPDWVVAAAYGTHYRTGEMRMLAFEVAPHDEAWSASEDEFRSKIEPILRSSWREWEIQDQEAQNATTQQH